MMKIMTMMMIMWVIMKMIITKVDLIIYLRTTPQA